jgi:FAS-associated factor 2
MEREGATSNASTGLRRRQFGANLDEQQNQQQLQQENRPHGASSSAAETNRSSKNLIEILLSPFINLLGDGTSEDPQEASRKFHESLRNKYGQHCPRFEHSSFRDAVTTARSASKFLLVFLYSEIHEDTDSFCRYILFLSI